MPRHPQKKVQKWRNDGEEKENKVVMGFLSKFFIFQLNAFSYQEFQFIEVGLNDKQPISIGGIIYKSSYNVKHKDARLETRTGVDYVYHGIENNNIVIKVQVIKQGTMNLESLGILPLWQIPLNPWKQAVVKFDYKDYLITVINEENRIVVYPISFTRPKVKEQFR